MPDITMCTGEKCPLKETCFRHMASANGEYQSFFVTPPIENGKCDYHMEIWKTVTTITKPRRKNGRR